MSEHTNTNSVHTETAGLSFIETMTQANGGVSSDRTPLYIYWWQSLRAEIARRVSIIIQQIYSINSTATIGNGTKPRDELMKLLRLQQQQQQQQQRQSLRHTILLSYNSVLYCIYVYICWIFYWEPHIMHDDIVCIQLSCALRALCRFIYIICSKIHV